MLGKGLVYASQSADFDVPRCNLLRDESSVDEAGTEVTVTRGVVGLAKVQGKRQLHPISLWVVIVFAAKYCEANAPTITEMPRSP